MTPADPRPSGTRGRGEVRGGLRGQLVFRLDLEGEAQHLQLPAGAVPNDACQEHALAAGLDWQLVVTEVRGLLLGAVVEVHVGPAGEVEVCDRVGREHDVDSSDVAGNCPEVQLEALTLVRAGVHPGVAVADVLYGVVRRAQAVAVDAVDGPAVGADRHAGGVDLDLAGPLGRYHTADIQQKSAAGLEVDAVAGFEYESHGSLRSCPSGGGIWCLTNYKTILLFTNLSNNLFPREVRFSKMPVCACFAVYWAAQIERGDDIFDRRG